MTHFVQFVISIADRVVHIAGITTRPDEASLPHVGRNLLDEESEALASMPYLIVDRDTKYTPQFRRLVEESGMEVIRLPPMSPNLNAAYSDRFVRSIRERMPGEDDLRRTGVAASCDWGRSNATTPAIPRKTALRGSIRSYYEFATHRVIQIENAEFVMHTVTSSCA